MRLWLGGAVLVCLVTPVPAADAPKPPAKSFQVPFRLSDSNHVVVRAKLNGKGPFNFALDTGAPYLFVSTVSAKKAGIEPDPRGWGTIDRFEIEGGGVIDKAHGRIDTLARLEAGNSMGLTGITIHGLLGYEILARYKIELDLTQDKMTWTRLDFKPPRAPGAGAKGSEPIELDALANLMKTVGALLTRKPPEPKPRGFLGIELADTDRGAMVKSVLAGSPAARAGLRAEDRITHFGDQTVKNRADLLRLAALVAEDETVTLTVRRGKEPHKITLKAGKGL